MSLSYVLVTPVRNEAEYVERTLQSVVSQTVLPAKWIIVSDGSTDGTDDIIKRFLPGRPWMELLRLPEHKDRHFASKVKTFNAGFEKLNETPYDIIGCLDADVSFEADYFEYLLGKFEADPSLGVAGTDYIEGNFHSFRDSYINVHHVNGQIQLFRRKTFADIGGYVPSKGGGIDWVAVTTARMKGWLTYSFSEKTFRHHKPMGTGESNAVAACFKAGKKDYFLGGHPLWEFCRCGFQMMKKPYLVGGGLTLLGYLWAWGTFMKRSVSPELMRFHRQEQMQRLKQLFGDKFKPLKRATS